MRRTWYFGCGRDWRGFLALGPDADGRWMSRKAYGYPAYVARHPCDDRPYIVGPVGGFLRIGPVWVGGEVWPPERLLRLEHAVVEPNRERP